MIQLENVCKVYSTEEIDTHALININLNIDKGEFLSICGPSGGGKSTLLAILATHDNITQGRYLFEGNEMREMNRNDILKFRRENIGYIFQEFNLIDDLTVEDNIGIHLLCQKLTKKEITDRVSNLMEHFGLTHRRKHFPYQLSGGQQQRVAVARAMANNPKIIFADEPTGNLDSHNANVVIDLLKSAHSQGTTICMVTHDYNYAKIAQRILLLKDGKLLEA